MDDKALIETIEFLQAMRSHIVIRRKEMDDDCERGMFRAYHILTTLIEHDKCSFKNISPLISLNVQHFIAAYIYMYLLYCRNS